MTRGELHRRLVREAAECGGLTVKVMLHGWHLVDADGTLIWRVYWLSSGYFAGARDGNTDYFPDYRTHAATSTPRQILDFWLRREFPEVER